MNILITGSNGFLCQKLIKKLMNKSHFIIGTDKDKNILENKKNFTFLRCDISNKAKLLKKITLLKKKIDLIIHTAAIQPISNDQDIKSIILVNSFGATNILQICKKLHIKNLIFTSSFSVYGQHKNPIKENSIKSPQNFYGMSKMFAEEQITLFSKRFNMNYIILRLDGIFGHKQNLPGFSKMCFEKFVKNENIELFNSGSQIRDHVYIDDAVNSIVLSIKKLKKIKKGIFNIGGGQPISNYTRAMLIKKNLDSKSKLIKIKRSNPNISNIYLDLKRAKKILGYEPKSVNQNTLKYLKELTKNEK